MPHCPTTSWLDSLDAEHGEPLQGGIPAFQQDRGEVAEVGWGYLTCGLDRIRRRVCPVYASRYVVTIYI
jgi:hypothetical protein